MPSLLCLHADVQTSTECNGGLLVQFFSTDLWFLMDMCFAFGGGRYVLELDAMEDTHMEMYTHAAASGYLSVAGSGSNTNC